VSLCGLCDSFAYFAVKFNRKDRKEDAKGAKEKQQFTTLYSIFETGLTKKAASTGFCACGFEQLQRATFNGRKSSATGFASYATNPN
jgi:hypothetical protein